MRRSLWAPGIIVALLVIMIRTGIFLLRPPILAGPHQGFVLSDVTVILGRSGA
jgi:hypothetical protein